MHGIIEGNIDTDEACRMMNCENIAYYYSAWFYSNPFDIDIVSRNSFSALEERPHKLWAS